MEIKSLKLKAGSFLCWETPDYDRPQQLYLYLGKGKWQYICSGLNPLVYSVNEDLKDPKWSEIPMSSLNVVKEEVVVTKRDIYKVPIFKKGNVFVIWTGEGAVRYFNEDTLPDLVKVPLGIIMNSPRAAELNQKEMSDMDMAKGVLQDELFKTGGLDKAFEDIGWQYNKYYYVVVLSAEELASIKGQGSTETPAK